MPTFEIQSPDGRTFEIDGPDQAGAIQALQRHLADNGGYGVKQQDTLVGDVAKSAAAGVGKGAIGIAATPNLLDQMAGGIVGLPERAYRWATGSGFTLSPETQKAAADYEANRRLGPPSADTMQKAVEQVTGEFHKPQTTAGKYAETVGEFLPAAAMSPGNLGANLLKYGVAPGLTSEAAGQATAGTKLEPYARIGAALATIPLANAAGNRIADALAPADALSGMNKRARNYVVNITDPQKLASARQEMDKLGPEAVLADVSPEFSNLASGAAARPESRKVIFDVLNTRDAGKNGRIADTVDTNLGKAIPPKDIVADIVAQRKAQTGPLFRQAFDNAPPVDVSNTLATIEKQLATAEGPEKSALLGIKKMLVDQQGSAGTAAQRVPVTDASGRVIRYETRPATPATPTTYKTNAENLHNVKGSIDNLIKYGDQGLGISPGTLSREQGALKQVRGSLNQDLRAQVPGYAQANDISRSFAQQANAVERGQTVFDSGKTAIWPQELAREVAGNAPEVNQRLSQSARADLERIVGQNANDVEALLRTLKGDGDWNRDKLRTLFSPDKADKVLAILDAEKQMQNTKNFVTGGPQTAQRLEVIKMLNDIAKGPKFPLDTTTTGLAARGTQKLVEMLAKNGGEKAADQAALDLGRLSVAKGPEADALVQALLRRVTRQNQGRGGQLGTGAAAIIRALSAPSSN